MGADTHVLVIDGDEDARLVCTAHLRQQGFEVASAGSGPEGLRLAAEHPPDAVILAARLPDDGDGWEVLTELQASPATQAVPVVMLVDEQQAEAAAGFSHGAAGYLTKPFAPDALSQLVDSALEAADPPSGGD